MPNPPVVGWKSYQNEAKTTVDANALTALEKEYKRVHTLAAAGPLGAKPDDVSDVSIFALDEKGPNAQFLTSYSSERAPVRISFELLEKVLDDADNDGVVPPGAPVTRLTAEEKALQAVPIPPGPPLDLDNKPSIEFESAEGAIQYLRTRYMMQRGFFGAPPADAKFTNIDNILTSLIKASPSEARQLPEAKSLTVAAGANTSIQDVFANAIAHPPAGMPNPAGGLAGDLKTTVNGLITESVVTRQFTQNPALADSLLQTINPDGSLKKIFTLDEKKEIEEKQVFINLRQDPALVTQLKQAQSEYKSEAKATAIAPDLSNEIKSLHGTIEKQHMTLAALAKRTLIDAKGLEKMLPRTAYPFHEAKHLIDGFNYAKEQILAKTAAANLEKVSLILGKQQRQVSVHYAKLTQGEFSLDQWNKDFKEARRELANLGVPNDALDKLQTDSLRDQIKADSRTIKEKSSNAYTALLNDEIRMQQANKNRSNWQRFRAAISETYNVELKKQETARLIEFKYLGADVKNPNPDGNRAFATIVAGNVQVRPGSELRAGTLANASSPYIVQVNEQKNAQGHSDYSFKTFYKTEAEAEAAHRNLFNAIKSRAGTNEIKVTFPEPDKVIIKDVIGMLKAARDAKMFVDMDINHLMAIKPPTTPEEREQFAEITRLKDASNQAAELEKQQMQREAKSIPVKNAERIADEQAAKQMHTLQKKVEQSLRTLSSEIKQAAGAGPAGAPVIDVKTMSADLKKAENHIQELKTRLKEAKDEFWRIRQEYKATQSGLPNPPTLNEHKQQELLKAQLGVLLNASSELAYAQARLNSRLDAYAAEKAAPAAEKAQATQLANSAKALGDEMKNFIHTEMEKSYLSAAPAYNAPPPPGVPAAAPAFNVGPNLFKDSVALAQKEENQLPNVRQYKI